MLGWILGGGLCLKGANSLCKDAKYQAQVQAAGHKLLVSCKTSDEVISTKCIFSDNPDMPRLTESELRIIEDWYRSAGGVNRDIMTGYNKQTGNSLIDVVRGK